ncbi:ATP synthase F1 subunit delta [Mycoplasmopsis iners]|uniref:ATP synthase F1 subunit delta n=1 Tax=Mycoplasmopsis iners TaxID=76630 RepID=UPI000497C1A7|nr:ATP synthase F1 subunit delta [Mycoplasmopsis iners]
MYKKTNLDAYALAIYELSVEMGVAKETTLLLTALFKELKKDTSFIDVLKNNEISNERKYEFIEHVFANFEKSTIVKDFLKVVVEHKASNNLLRIIGVYLRMVNENLNMKFAKIYSAFPIPEDKLALIKAKLEKENNCLVDIEHIIDPEIISGFKIKMDSFIIENSLGADLKKLKNIITKKEEV